MAADDLTQASFDLAFAFARSAAAQLRGNDGQIQTAPVDAPRFDHDAAGQPLGLLVTPGADLGEQDRVSIDPLILPAALTESAVPGERAATIFHAFIPAGESQLVRRAWYSRDAARSIDTLMRQAGHHAEIGVIAGFRENLGGYVRLRGEVWQLTGIIDTGGGLLANDDGRPLVSAGAEFFA